MMRLGWVAIAALVIASGCNNDDVAPSGATDTEAGTAGDPSTGAAASESEGDATLDETGEPPLGPCEGPTAMLYDPLAASLDAFPDDFFTVAEDTPTGIRVDMRLGENVVLGDNAAAFNRVFEAVSTLDGFGTTAGLYVQFSDAIDPASLPGSGEGSDATDASVVLVDLDADPPVFVAFEWQLVAEDPGQDRTTLVIDPLVPLAPMHRHALAITRGVTDAAGDCIAPSATMAALLAGDADEPELTRVAEGVDAAIDVLTQSGRIDDVLELSGVVTFTTQHTWDESATIAAQIRDAAPPVFTPTTPCDDGDPSIEYRQCSGTFMAPDFTDGDVVDPSLAPQSEYELRAVVYLPKNATAPFPTLIFGHGLNGDRFQAGQLAELTAENGIAVIAIDAPRHGDHPHGGTSFAAVLDFFGLSLNFDDPLDALKLRDNFRQASYDKIAMVQMLRTGVDVDEDGQVDLDPDRLGYLGVSLGGLMGPELVAFAPELHTAIFIVPGARVSAIVRDGEDFSVIVDAFAGMASDGDVARFFPLLQTVIDRGDPGVYAPWVATARLPGFDEASPQVLMQMVLDDTVVPNSTNTYFARCLGVPHLGEVIVPIGVVPHTPELPVSGNLDRAHTGGVFQYDIVYDGEGPATEPADHGNVARSTHSQLQISHFLNTFDARGVAEILDPYEELGP